jgi:hypothetical protein
MTTRLKGFLITLDDDIRDDDAKPIREAIEMIRHVQSCVPIPTNADDYMARDRARMELEKKLFDVLIKDRYKEKK